MALLFITRRQISEKAKAQTTCQAGLGIISEKKERQIHYSLLEKKERLSLLI